MCWVYTKNKQSVCSKTEYLVAKQDFLTSRWRDVIIVGRQSTKPTNYKAPKAKPEKAIMYTTMQKKRWRLGFDSRPNHWVASKKPWPLRFYGQFGMDKNGRSFFLTQAFKAYSGLEKSLRISMHYIAQPQENYKIFLMQQRTKTTSKKLLFEFNEKLTITTIKRAWGRRPPHQGPRGGPGPPWKRSSSPWTHWSAPPDWY